MNEDATSTPSKLFLQSSQSAFANIHVLVLGGRNTYKKDVELYPGEGPLMD